jgi:hypothetical protein
MSSIGVARAQQTAAPQQSPAASPATSQANPIVKPPLPNRANDVLPPWLRLRGEFRERFEGFTGGGFVAGRDDTYSLSRFRINATVTANPWMSFQVQAQDARVARKQVPPTTGAPVNGPFDLRTAFADIGTAKSRVAARVGRQELAYGEQRLLGHLNWTNTARSVDAARVTFRTKPVQVDVFGGSVVRIMSKEFDKSGNGNKLFGAYATAGTVVPGATVEPYVIVRADRNLKPEIGAPADLLQTTMGARWVGRLPGRLDYGVEMAAQAGSLGQDSIGAWAGHWQLREALPGKAPIRLIGEFNFATGDKNPIDGKRGTFDQLYPTGHDKLGLSDQIGWRNIRHLRGGVELPPWKKAVVTSSVHSWWLADGHDALYNSAGAALIARKAAGVSSTHIGQEFDAQVTRAITPQLQLAGGYAHIFPGPYLKSATPGASYNYPYVMATYVFLADK